VEPAVRAPEGGAAVPGPEGVAAAVALLSAMAHPTRLTVLLALGRSGPQSAGDLQRASGVEQSALSHQLRILREARLVVGERQGRQVIYRLHDHHVAHMVEDALSHVAEG
jgi:ArsR family transcriptional regulator, nickel/cobalt-responsive transcriptional repressor